MNRWLRILLFAAVATGCTDASAPNVSAVLVVESDPIVATVNLAGEVEWLQPPVPVVIHNTGSARQDKPVSTANRGVRTTSM